MVAQKAAQGLQLDHHHRVTLYAGEVLEQSPWYEKYRHEFFRMLAFSEHECYDHPVACEPLLSSACRAMSDSRVSTMPVSPAARANQARRGL